MTHKFKGVTVRNQPYSESFDEYLETIYRLSLKNPGGWVKNKDISERLEVKAPSVTSMVKKLSLSKLIDWKARHGIRLTEKGRERGKTLVRNHIILELFLERTLKIRDPVVINQIACDIEHHMDENLTARFSKLLGIDANLTNVDNFILEDKLPAHLETRQIFSEQQVIEMVDSIKNQFLGLKEPYSRKDMEKILDRTIENLKADR